MASTATPSPMNTFTQPGIAPDLILLRAMKCVLAEMPPAFIDTLCLDVKTNCIDKALARCHYPRMPKLWNDTIEAHRSAVASAVMDKTAELAAREGLHTLTMARIAQEAGIGRATLYKYFPDVEGILSAWHKRQISTHLEGLERIRKQAATPLQALEAVLIAYGESTRHGHDHAFGSLLHAMPHVREAHGHLEEFVADMIAEATRDGNLSGDVPPGERARYALAAVAGGAPNKPALVRLVGMILRGLGAQVPASAATL